MGKSTTARPLGRPRSEGKRAAIIEAARDLFVSRNYDSVTMDEIASAAGVAKMTVYGHFHDKAALFEAMVRSTSDMIVAALPEQPPRDGVMEEELVVFGQAFLAVLFAADVVNSFHRYVDTLSRNRAMAERFYDSGPGRTRTMLARYLTSAAGWVDRPPEWSMDAASDLMNLWVGDRPQRMALGLADPITPDQIAQDVRRCVRLFLRAYGLTSAGRPEDATP